jgi:release factor glutamine methyltransferase
VLNRPRSWILAHPEANLTIEHRDRLERLAQDLTRGVPLPYLLGHWEFFGLDFLVTPDTLIPRPETETLVEYALDWLREHPNCRSAADVGTGTGCIAITLATKIPDLRFVCHDISFPALKIAGQNARKHRVDGRIEFVQTDLLSCTRTTFDLICANLPYIPTQKLLELEIYGREPSLALDGGLDGLDLIRNMLQESRPRLSDGGLLLLEIEAGQGAAVLSLAQNTFQDGQVHLQSDLAGRDRLLAIEMKS